MSDEADAGLAQAIAGAPMPIVLIDRELLQNVDRVMADHQSGAEQAIEHLLSLGHTRIGMIFSDPAAYPSRSRIVGYRQAHAKRGVVIDGALIRDHALSNEITFRETCALLSAAERPTALFAAAGWSPGATSRSSPAAILTSPISALSWDRAETGRHAAEMLLDRIRDFQPRAPRCVRLPVRSWSEVGSRTASATGSTAALTLGFDQVRPANVGFMAATQLLLVAPGCPEAITRG